MTRKTVVITAVIFSCAAMVLGTGNPGFAFSVDYDGDGVPDAYGTGGGVPDVPAPTPVPVDTSGSSSSSTQQTTTQAAPKVHKSTGPTTEQMIQTTIMSSVIEGMFSSIFAPPADTGPDPAELQRQQEEQRKLEEQKRQEFLRQNAKVSSSLKTPGQENKSADTHSQFFGVGIKSPPDQSILNDYAKPSGVDIGWGTMPVSLRQQNSISEAEWTQAREYQNRIDQLRKKDTLTKEEIAALEEAEAKRNATWQKAISDPTLTQEERERLKLKMYSAPAELGDHPMVDSRAFAQREQWTDPYLDVATAAAKGGATSVAVSLTEEGGKGVLKTFGGSDIGYDEVLAGGKAGIEPPKSTADKVIAVGEYAAGKIFKPKQVIIVTGTANTVGAGTRQAIVRYWAGQDEESLTPVADAKERWNNMVSNRDENVQSMLNWVGAGRYKD